MGFLLPILGFYFLLAVSVLLTVIYVPFQLLSKQPVHGRALGCIWSPPLGLILLCILGLTLLTSCERMPRYRQVSPSDVYGTYRIDRKFFPGKNADWQYEHFKFTITTDNKLVLTEIDDKGIPHQYAGKVTWSDTETRRALWSAKLDKKHHLRLASPTLYRSYFQFYYVIHSDKYGNMFFRRESDYPAYEFGFSLLAIPLIWYFHYHNRRTAGSRSTWSS